MKASDTGGSTGRPGARIGAGVAALVLAVWSLLTSLAGINTVMSHPTDPLALLLSAVLSVGVISLASGVIAIAAAGWHPGLTLLVTHGVLSLIVTAVFFIAVAASPWSAAGVALSAAVLALGQLAR
ncbi:hypothetical protein [Crystallibacter degradans]|uniref:hypothetical protein n=1 Tax=Crystallibacter degradans TaxID=2726743 RepID=UPI0014759FC3|nr:hypothetical protein [Arthrobacter sp. SF27]NMR32333.1 hypothetical protein [Arthrobacter sp. SF27]